MIAARRAQALRRYPALAFLVVAGFLATMLPSALRLPLSGPTQAAELAPVPGKGDAPDGDLAELGLGSSTGLGAGGSGTGAGATSDAAGAVAGAGANPRTKRCVGRPPRQTEDPFSPPCVAYFAGDNGGATARGVSADEIVVVVHWGVGTTSDPDGFHDLAAPPAPEDTETIRVGKAYNRYFNERYQYYGRRLHMWGFFGPENQRDVVVAIDDEKKPFAFVKSVLTGDRSMLLEAAARRMIAVSHAGFLRSDYQRVAPYLVSYQADVEDQAEISSSYICSKLAGAPARFAPDVSMQDDTRVFGLFRQNGDTTFSNALKEAGQRRCGLRFAAEAETPVGNAAGYHTAVASFRDAGVTSVVMAVGSGGTNLMTAAAGSQGYLPEWVLPGGGSGDIGPDRNASGRLNNQAAWRGAFGITFEARRDHYHQQPWFRAFMEACPGCPEPASASGIPGRMYSLIAMLSYGMQAAGPRLTPAAFDRGMHSIPQRGSPNPYVPAAYFAPGNFSFLKDATSIWWDPQGEEPGWSARGCYRLVEDGARYRAGEWPRGDADLFRMPAPCQVLDARPAA